MPNTFVHLGIQTLTSRALLKGSDFKWIAIGCIIPDLPWIMQRLFRMVAPGLDQYTLLNYFSSQASFFSCLIVSGALALLVGNSGRIFLLLAANSLLHLLLDALQIKWANGVHLLAPFSWQVTGFNLIWPEHPAISLLTVLGVVVMFYYGFRDRQKTVILARGRARYITAACLILLYGAAPLFLSTALFQADSHFTATLRNRDERSGKYLELDRSPYRSRDHTVRILNDERITLQGAVPKRDAIISVKGFFIDANTIHISELHVHSALRDISSMIALAGVLFVWLIAFMQGRVARAGRL